MSYHSGNQNVMPPEIAKTYRERYGHETTKP
jgi:hypothetical protein